MSVAWCLVLPATQRKADLEMRMKVTHLLPLHISEALGVLSPRRGHLPGRCGISVGNAMGTRNTFICPHLTAVTGRLLTQITYIKSLPEEAVYLDSTQGEPHFVQFGQKIDSTPQWQECDTKKDAQEALCAWLERFWRGLICSWESLLTRVPRANSSASCPHTAMQSTRQPCHPEGAIHLEGGLYLLLPSCFIPPKQNQSARAEPCNLALWLIETTWFWMLNICLHTSWSPRLFWRSMGQLMITCKNTDI